jgi:hypothetical protein
MEIPIQERADMTLEIYKGETENQAFFLSYLFVWNTYFILVKVKTLIYCHVTPCFMGLT